MSIQLLDKIRKINKLLHNSESGIFVFSDICKVISDVLESNALVISKSGKILGIGINQEIAKLEELIGSKVGEYIEESLNERLLEILSTKENVYLVTLGFENEMSGKYQTMITPIEIAGNRLGTLFIYRDHLPYEIDDIILCEYANTVVGLEMVRSISEENDRDKRNKQTIEGAISSMSLSERKAIKVILEKLEGNEGIVVASRIAAESDITRSVIVNALRKFESAGIIYTHSNGMKGTYIKVLKEGVYRQLV
ncbi:MAG: GTP-sensing pleiotropic transcriptional regulator CodY [Lachnospiraceae bacterium]|nr:GTP-sensing pleiotropic transcriptional regulator CodY [Lachnospiraceae bacterium]